MQLSENGGNPRSAWNNTGPHIDPRRKVCDLQRISPLKNTSSMEIQLLGMFREFDASGKLHR
jgi:hypothetical protein